MASGHIRGRLFHSIAFTTQDIVSGETIDMWAAQ